MSGRESYDSGLRDHSTTSPLSLGAYVIALASGQRSCGITSMIQLQFDFTQN